MSKEKKRGQPTKYDPKYCDMLIKHMASGLSFDSFAGEANVHLDTLYEWAKVHEDFSEAKKTAFSKNLAFWEKAGLQGMWGDKESNMVFNPTVWIFNMKNRHRWRDKQEVEVKDESQSIRDKISKMSMKELMDLVKNYEEKNEKGS